MNVTKYVLLFIIGGFILLSLTYFVLDYSQEPLSLENIDPDVIPGSFLNLSQGKTHYQFHGSESGELIVLVHGGGSTGCYVWSKTIPALTNAGYRVLCYDLYGRGYSSSPKIAYSPELIYDQLIELLDSLSVREDFYLFGLSMGAMPATMLAAKNPERIKKLVYIAPSTLGGFKPKWYLQTPLLSDLLMTFYWYPQSLASQMGEFYVPEKALDYKNKLKYFMKIKGYKRVNLSTWLHTNTVNFKELLQDVGDNSLPVLLILGREDPYISPHFETVYQESIPHISSYVIKETGHMPHYEKPNEVNTIILNFLNDCSRDL